MKYYIACLKKYAVFEGRARRKEFWMFFLFNWLIFIAWLIGVGVLLAVVGVALAAVGVAAGNAPQVAGPQPTSANGWIMPLAIQLYLWATIIPMISVTVRRLHDTGRSGWWWWFHFIPLVGPIVMVFFLCSRGNPVENKYGPNPCVSLGKCAE